MQCFRKHNKIVNWPILLLSAIIIEINAKIYISKTQKIDGADV